MGVTYRRRKKKEGDEDYEYMSHKVSYKWIRKTQVIPEYVVFYNVWGFYLVVFLVGICFRGGLLFYPFSIHILSYDVSVFVV